LHWLNVAGRATSFSISSMGRLCNDIALQQVHF
jgi:hypothetical protein